MMAHGLKALNQSGNWDIKMILNIQKGTPMFVIKC